MLALRPCHTYDIVDDIVDVSSSTISSTFHRRRYVQRLAKIAFARASLTKSLRVAGP